MQEVGGGDRVACCRHWILVRDRSGSLREKCVLLPLRQLCVHYKNQAKVLGRVGTGCSQDGFGPWWPANPTAREVLSEPSKSSKALAKSHLWKMEASWVSVLLQICESPRFNQFIIKLESAGSMRGYFLKSRHGFLPWRNMASRPPWNHLPSTPWSSWKPERNNHDGSISRHALVLVDS